MKNKTRVIIALMSIFMILVGETNSYAIKPKLTIKLDIGRRSLDCKKFSICSIEIGISERLASNQANAVAEITKDGKFKVSIKKSKGMTDECYNTYFSSGTFLVEEAFDIPIEVLTELDNSPETLTVRAGNYDITENNDELIIVF